MTNTDMDTLEFYWRCIEADMELSGTPLLPEDVVMSYCGCGTSATVTAGEIRRHLRQYRETLERVRELEGLIDLLAPEREIDLYNNGRCHFCGGGVIYSDDDDLDPGEDTKDFRHKENCSWVEARAAIAKHGEGKI